MSQAKKKSARVVDSKPLRHHLDRRAARLAALAVANNDKWYSTAALADWLGVSTQFLEIGRHRGYGPPFKRVTPKMIRYRHGDVMAWLNERSHVCTSEYRGQKTRSA
jgi:hypothetical protein